MNKLLFYIIVCLPTISSALCIDYKNQVNQAVQTKNFDQLKELLPTLEKEGCASNYIEALQNKLAQIIAVKADELMMNGQFEQARALLQRSTIVNWETQIIRADIAAFEGNWQKATKLYDQSLDLINDPQATPQAPDTETIQKIFQLASEAQILAGTLDSSRPVEHGIMLDDIRGFKPDKLLIPIKFEFNKSALSLEGEKSAQQLGKYIEQHDFQKIILIGHTDAKGSNIINDKISVQRALTLKNYLKKIGVKIPITAIGQGKRTPLMLDDINRYTEEEINSLNRRVEVITE
ncbi:OmpA family protein [Thiotrichales bacterium HSG1]|nr:OmpA family protein [Thiotrichales bacterium HSG1]